MGSNVKNCLVAGVDLAIKHLEESVYGEENDLRLLRGLSAKLKRESATDSTLKVRSLASLLRASNAALDDADQMRSDGYPLPHWAEPLRQAIGDMVNQNDSQLPADKD